MLFHEDSPRYYLDKSKIYNYAKHSDDNSGKLLNETNDALSLLDFTNKEQDLIFKIISSILHLGNNEFKGLDNTQETHDKALENFCKLLDIEEILKFHLFHKRIDNEFQKLTLTEALIARDALADYVFSII